MTEFKLEQKVCYRNYANGATGVIKHIEDNVAMVKFGYQDNRTVKLSDLVSAEPVKPAPFKPGWYSQSFSLLNPRTHHYYCYQSADGSGKIMYTNSYNPVTGEMDATWMGGLLIPRVLEGVTASQLYRLKMVQE